jgi:hypothetical protein
MEQTVVVGADLEGLVAAHDESGLSVLLVLQQLDVTSSTLLPLLRVGIKLEKLSTPRASLDFNLINRKRATHILKDCSSDSS